MANTHAIGDTRVKLMDCTVRDGGYVLGWGQPLSYVSSLLKAAKSSAVDYVEIGFCNTRTSSEEWWSCVNQGVIECLLPDAAPALALMMDYGKQTVAGLSWIASAVRPIMVRVACRPDDWRGAATFCRALGDMGVQSSLNAMALSMLSVDDLKRLAGIVNEFSLPMVYLADSFGACFPPGVTTAYRVLQREGVICPMGFHGHDNLTLAFANSIAAVAGGATLVDGTVAGVGRGGGNLLIELAVAYWRGALKADALLEWRAQYMGKTTGLRPSEGLATGVCNAHPNYGAEAWGPDRQGGYYWLVQGLLGLTPEQRIKFSRSNVHPPKE